MIHFGHKNVLFFGYILYYFEGKFSFISSSVLINISMDFWHKASNTIFINFQMIIFFNKLLFIHMLHKCTHLHLFEWKFSYIFFLWNHINRTLHMELKWGNEFICNIWLNTSSSLVIIWIVLKVYLHFVIYCDDYNFLTNIYFDHLISISKWDLFLQS
jgi:hypothetical protein